MSREEQRECIRETTDEIIHHVDMIEHGLATRQGGLIYFLPLCHDSYGEGAA